MKEQELASLCLRGDDKARRELYERYAGRMLVMCRRYVSRCDTAEDLLHDGFLKIYSSFDKFEWRGEGSLRAWMERVMANVALQYLRKNDVLARAAAIDDLPPEDYDRPDAAEVEAVPRQVLLDFIADLPVGYRTVFNLYVFQGKSHKEIARLLGINDKSSASQLARAKAALASRIKDWMRKHQ